MLVDTRPCRLRVLWTVCQCAVVYVYVGAGLLSFLLLFCVHDSGVDWRLKHAKKHTKTTKISSRGSAPRPLGLRPRPRQKLGGVTGRLERRPLRPRGVC